MLRPKTLTQVLGQVISGGVQGALILNKEGTLLAFAGYDDKNARMTAAIASSIWVSYEKYGRVAFNEDPLKSYTMQCEDGNIVVSQVAKVLVCVHGQPSVPLGTLKAKVNALVQYLDEPLKQISNI